MIDIFCFGFITDTTNSELLNKLIKKIYQCTPTNHIQQNDPILVHLYLLSGPQIGFREKLNTDLFTLHKTLSYAVYMCENNIKAFEKTTTNNQI